MKKFSETLNYASCNEDWRTEWEALAIEPEDTVLCVTGSGDRPLDLLPQNPKLVIAFDRNPIQNHLLQLKMAAISVLSYEAYAAFLGLHPSDSRSVSWQLVRDHLPRECAAFWDRNISLIENGVIYQGRWEKHFRRIATVAKSIRGRTIRQLFEFRDIESQRQFVYDVWDRWWWRLFFHLILSERFSRILFGDPGFYAFTPRNAKVGAYIFERLTGYLLNHLARESFMLNLALTGRLGADDLPPYLHPASQSDIASRLYRVETREGDVIAVMRDLPPESISKFSLSDIPSFVDQDGFETMLDAMVSCASEGARFCIRTFLTDQTIPPRFDNILVRDRELEQRLQTNDRSIAYRFLVGKILTSH
jgi:S-adenosylmethionine-diacylglycerol 3-amino-3-carboxypropyl transferase